MNGFGIMISIGKWGGFYVYTEGWSKRICLGWVAITLVPSDGDAILEAAMRYFIEHDLAPGTFEK